MWWCRGQDLNLRTTEDWDLIPAPLTKLGNLCKSNPATDHFLIKATGSKWLFFGAALLK